MSDLHVPALRRLHTERHAHRCPMHARGKCKHQSAAQTCAQCVFVEDNEVCGKTLRGTKLEYHDYPCMPCLLEWRNRYGGELLVDAFINMEQAQRLNDIAG